MKRRNELTSTVMTETRKMVMNEMGSHSGVWPKKTTTRAIKGVEETTKSKAQSVHVTRTKSTRL